MSFSTKSPEHLLAVAEPSTSPFASEGGVAAPLSGSRDPYEALDDLLSVTDQLCPVRPNRATFRASLNFLL
jgi:hypothetical protein